MFENSDNFYFMPCTESDRLLIVFSGAGAKSFNCFKLLQQCAVNRLFVRDESRSWYQNPVEGHWKDIDGLIELIKSVSDAFDPQNIICMGGSMGGYAAMVVAAKLMAGKALLFSPQTILDHRLPNNPAAHISVRYPDAFAELAQSLNTHVKVYLGTEDLADLYNVYPVRNNERVDISFVYRAPHNLMNFLFRRGMLKEIIMSQVESRPYKNLLPEVNFCNQDEEDSD